MEKRGELKILDRKLLTYFQKHNYNKNDKIQAYSTVREDVASFYSVMKNYLYHNQFQKKVSMKKKSSFRHHSGQKYKKFTNPIFFSLPKKIDQRNTISILNIQKMKAITTPMHSQVQTKKLKLKYVISSKVKHEIIQDIKKMQLQRQNKQFNNLKRSKTNESMQQKSVIPKFTALHQIQKFNKILMKYNQKLLRAQEDTQYHDQESNDTINLRCISLFQTLLLQNYKSRDYKLQQYLSKLISFMNNKQNASIRKRNLSCINNNHQNHNDDIKTVRKNKKQKSIHKDYSQFFITNNQQYNSNWLQSTTKAFFKSLPQRNIRITSATFKNNNKQLHQQPFHRTNLGFKNRLKSSSIHKKLIYNPNPLEAAVHPQKSMDKIQSRSTSNLQETKQKLFSLNKMKKTQNKIKLRIIQNNKYNNDKFKDKYDGMKTQQLKFRTKTIITSVKLKL